MNEITVFDIAFWSILMVLLGLTFFHAWRNK